MDLYGEFEWRGLIYDATEGAREALARETVTGYIGFDPTAPSLHVGIAARRHGAGASAARRPFADRASSAAAPGSSAIRAARRPSVSC